MPDIKTAKRVLRQEIAGLEALENALGQEFIAVAQKIEDLIKDGKGRVVISGMGKSGHVAKKIAATLASTGTPAFFVHPAEASHGDLGMITAHDIVILLSNSGETAELKDISAYCKRFGIFLVGIVRKKTSALVDAADIALILPDTEEANSVNAPTTSTTMMMALGDALAVSLLESRGFENEDFKTFHPGGKLGAAFLTVAELMHKGSEIPLVDMGQKMSEALMTITGKKFGCAGVVESGKLVGIITDGDVRRHMDADFLGKKVADVMTKNPVTIRPKALAAEALNIMNTRQITSVFVAEDSKPVGIIHIHDLLRAGV
ncbi:MAG: KpsF/GutQ family sugar-phosphate isomerase [Alphaproteobacteria bacterium CG11_big_fil_rev_8_21_14_0_20_44_7]|nr:MAG: KpsF/GutQ family sugar-phosphate isomerase [Alphaproteobacteria bacterium CG11_big_fil_rev_8_21_14_0_20_44_7]